MASWVPLVRSASLNGYSDIARGLGLNVEAMFRQVGLPSRALADPDTLLRADAVRALLERSAEASGVEDLGLRIAATRQFSNLGPVSLVLQDEPTVRQALETLCRYVELLNPSLKTWLETRDDMLLVREEFVAAHGGGLRQAMDLAIGVLHRILVALLGAAWQPQMVCFQHGPPADETAHRLFFGTRVVFHAGFNGIVCRSAELDARRQGANPQLAHLAREYLEQDLSRGRESSTGVMVRQLMVVLLPGGRCTSQRVAQHLGVDRRTLHRHLERENTTFSGLLQETRVTLAQRLVGRTAQPLAGVALLMGFASPSAFAYWFNRSFGCGARVWRQRQMDVDARLHRGGVEGAGSAPSVSPLA